MNLVAFPVFSLLSVLVPAIGTGPVTGLTLAALNATSANMTSTATTTMAGPMVEITKNCPGLRYLNRDATFEITITNRGDAPAMNVVVTDTLSGAFSFKSADNGGSREGNNIVWRIGALEPGQSRKLTATVNCNQIGTIRNAAKVTYCAEAMAECSTQVEGIPAVLLECVDDPDPVEVGNTLTYTITVTNQGTAVGTNIRLVCTIPSEQEYVSSDGPTTGSLEGDKLTFPPVPQLAPKARATYKVTVRGVNDGDSRFRVEMNTDQTTSPVMETESTHIYR